jgi:phospholipase/carboxylesterase
MYTHEFNYITAGASSPQAKGAIVMIHGRGSSAENIIGLAANLNVDDYAVYAPQATNNSWYPYSFLAPKKDNDPALSSALALIDQLVAQIEADGIPAHEIYFVGFSQGACLTLEYIASHAKRYGGAVAFTGGLIGEELNNANYQGDFGHTPVFISTGDPDPHVPLVRVEESVHVLKQLNADITLKVYKGRPHTITQEEVDLAKELIFHQSYPLI